jgi:riboflavin kinase
MSYVIPTLKALALRGAASQFISISTRKFGKELDISQQMASNRLIALSKKGLIIRRRGGSRGQDIIITKDGMTLLRKEFGDYQRIFREVKDIEINGNISSGLGEGQYYLGQEKYISQIEDILGFRPFPGTLNVSVTPEEYSKLDLLPDSAIIRIGGFRAGGRTFGQAECIPVLIGKVECAIIIPKRSHHTDVLEIISASQLRKELKLEDGDGVIVRVELA